MRISGRELVRVQSRIEVHAVEVANQDLVAGGLHGVDIGLGREAGEGPASGMADDDGVFHGAVPGSTRVCRVRR